MSVPGFPARSLALTLGAAPARQAPADARACASANAMQANAPETSIAQERAIRQGE